MLKKDKAEKLIIVVVAMALAVLFLGQARGLLHDWNRYAAFEGLRGNLIIQTIFYALSILITGATLIYLNRKRD